MAGACAGWEDDAGHQFRCRFREEPSENEFDDKSYCRFHLPMGELGEGGKADWDDDQKNAISDDIIVRFGAEAKKPEDDREILNFSGALVPGIIRLSNVTIPWINFSGARFHRIADFREAWFLRHTDFDGAQFHRGADFHGAEFHGRASFEGVRFHELADFEAARFDEEAYFVSARFHGWANFAGSPDISQAEARQFNELDYNGARFHDSADFFNREFLAHTDFSSCVFEYAPDFHGSSLHQDTEFGSIHCFPDVTGPAAERAYRTLRLAMEGHRARAEEGMFFALEQKARRHGMDRRDPAYWLSLAYEKGSDYGLSVLRPLLWFLGGIVASTFVLYAVGFYADGFPGGAGRNAMDLAAKAADALNFFARQAFLPFDALRSADEVLDAYDFNPGGTGWLRAWGLLVTLFEGLAALLLILAVRWRYRR